MGKHVLPCIGVFLEAARLVSSNLQFFSFRLTIEKWFWRVLHYISATEFLALCIMLVFLSFFRIARCWYCHGDSYIGTACFWGNIWLCNLWAKWSFYRRQTYRASCTITSIFRYECDLLDKQCFYSFYYACIDIVEFHGAWKENGSPLSMYGWSALRLSVDLRILGNFKCLGEEWTV